MTKSQEKKLRTKIVEAIGDEYGPTDDVLIDKILMWTKIEERCKQELEDDCKPDGSSIAGSWQLLTTLAMCSKHIQSLYTKLGINHVKKAKVQIQTKDDDVDLNSILLN